LRDAPHFAAITLCQMISTENNNQIEAIKKRAGHLWRFL